MLVMRGNPGLVWPRDLISIIALTHETLTFDFVSRQKHGVVFITALVYNTIYDFYDRIYIFGDLCARSRYRGQELDFSNYTPHIPCILWDVTWWRHQMVIFSALLALCAGNSPVPVNSPHKGQWRGALVFSLICAWINGWVNNRETGDLRRNRGHYDVSVMHILWNILYVRTQEVSNPRDHDDVMKWKHFPRHWPFVRAGEFTGHKTFYHSSPYIDLCLFGIKIESDKDGLRRKYEDQS